MIGFILIFNILINFDVLIIFRELVITWYIPMYWFHLSIPIARQKVAGSTAGSIKEDIMEYLCLLLYWYNFLVFMQSV